MEPSPAERDKDLIINSFRGAAEKRGTRAARTEEVTNGHETDERTTTRPLGFGRGRRSRQEPRPRQAAPQPGRTITETRCGREPQRHASAQSRQPKPPQSLRSRVVVDAEVLRDPADGGAALVHRCSVRRDRLVNGQLKRLEELSLNRNLGDGAKPLRTRPPAAESHRDEAMPGNALQRSQQDRVVGLNAGPGRCRTGSLELSVSYSQPCRSGDRTNVVSGTRRNRSKRSRCSATDQATGAVGTDGGNGRVAST